MSEIPEGTQTDAQFVAVRCHGKLFLFHPDMPPHVWDGEKMERVVSSAWRGLTAPALKDKP